VRRALVALSLLSASVTAAAQSDSMTARLQTAIARHERGDRADAAREFARLVTIYNTGGSRLTSRELVTVAVALTYLGADDPQLFKDALRAYDRAIAADPDDLDAKTRLSELFLDKYNSADAKRTLASVLGRNRDYVPAIVIEARRRVFDGERGADSLVARALELEPENVPARVLRARFLADAEDYAGALRETDRALRAKPTDADALAFAIALRRVTGDSAASAEVQRRFTALYPRDAGAQLALSELFSRVRQYASAAAAAREAVRIDPASWRAHAQLGANLMRLGDIPAARASLETAFRGDPYDIWTKNTLDLLDTFGNYDELTRGPFRFVIEKPESRLLSLYLGEVAERAYATFRTRYGYTPAGPIRVEVYRSNADFSVRTVGLPGLGALGVSFGNTVAFDSPAAKDAGAFNWGATAWHELAHTFTLGASDHRVPRWLSEGLSVYEERRAHPGWGQHVSPGFLQAYADGKLVPVSRMNDGFVRPAYPAQVLFSYYQASLVCELIARDWGERALVEMLQAYKAGLTTERAVRRVLRTDLAALDRRFDAYMRERFAGPIAAIRDGSYAQTVALGRESLQRGDLAAAIAALDRARAAFPEYGGADGAYPLLVRALVAKGDKARAAEVLSTMTALGDVSYEAHVSLADLLLQLRDSTRAAAALEAAMFMNPYEVAQHEKLALLYARLRQYPKAVRERSAVVALNPVDRAEAFYQLAVAYRDAGAPADARRSVLRALEEAPHFERAQELLLALRDARKP
jgi:cellulose synthase operon protein C